AVDLREIGPILERFAENVRKTAFGKQAAAQLAEFRTGGSAPRSLSVFADALVEGEKLSPEQWSAILYQLRQADLPQSTVFFQRHRQAYLDSNPPEMDLLKLESWFLIPGELVPPRSADPG